MTKRFSADDIYVIAEERARLICAEIEAYILINDWVQVASACDRLRTHSSQIQRILLPMRDAENAAKRMDRANSDDNGDGGKAGGEAEAGRGDRTPTTTG